MKTHHMIRSLFGILVILGACFTTHAGGPPAQVGVDKNNLYFTCQYNTANCTLCQHFNIFNLGGGYLEWSVFTSAGWLTTDITSGSGDGRILASVDSSMLPPGTYAEHILVSTMYGGSRQIDVHVNILDPTAPATPPFGSFDTPLNGSTVSSSIPVTGWALDDVGVDNVKIYRGQGTDLTYIGDAVFVEGARPDVENAYPGTPNNYRAGWGYMLLTNFLPNGGNGTYQISAIAEDMEGNTTTLGVRTIHCDNSNAVKPFGAIDTPSQGGTASGSEFINWGWALTPQPNHIPQDGSTINVFVDGVNVGHPTYNQYRSDIATLFPGYPNSDGAAGYFYLDTTAYQNGVHTIQWTAQDSAGNTDGIGSRYFTIQNNSNDRPLPIPGNPVQQSSDAIIPMPSAAVIVANGDEVSVDFNSETMVSIDLGSYLDPPDPQPPGPDNFTGFSVVDGQYRPLPVGSHLDMDTGVFSWLPGPNFHGSHTIEFRRTSLSALVTQKMFQFKYDDVTITTRLYFPYIQSGSGNDSLACIINTSDTATVTGNLLAYGSNGTELDSKVVSLAPNERMEYLVSTDFDTPSDIRYMIFESSADTITGYMKFATGTSFRGAVPATTAVSNGEIRVSHIASNPRWITRMVLLNTSNAQVQATVAFSDGSTRTLTLAAGEQQVVTVRSLFSDTPQPGIGSAVITNAQGIVGLEVFESVEGSSNTYMGGILLNGDTQTDLTFPLFGNPASWWTGIVAFNSSGQNAAVTVSPFKTDGTALPVSTLNIDPETRLKGTLMSLGLPEDTAWFNLSSDRALSGFELIGSLDGKQLGGFNCLGISRTTGVLPRIETDGWTGIGVVNTDNSAGTVTLTAYDDQGAVIAAATFELNAREKIVSTAQGLFSENIGAATYITYSSTTEVAVYQLNGASNGLMLDALPGI